MFRLWSLGNCLTEKITKSIIYQTTILNLHYEKTY